MRHRGAVSIYVILSGASALFYRMIFVVEMFYQIKAVGLNPFQLVLVGTVGQAVALFVGQAPTGILAGHVQPPLGCRGGPFPRRCGYLVEGLVPQFVAVLAGQAVPPSGAPSWTSRRRLDRR